MISEKDQSLELIHQDLLSYLATLTSQNSNENCSHFCVQSDIVELRQSVYLRNKVMYEGEKTTSLEFDMPSNETAKEHVAEAVCGSSSAQEEIQLLSRQSSLIDEWFGNVSNAHPNDISVDSSLEALFASSEWQDFKVEMMPTGDDPATENTCQSVDTVPADKTVARAEVCKAELEPVASIPVWNTIPVEDTVVHDSLPACSTVCKAELEPDIVPENDGECSAPGTGGIYIYVYIPHLFAVVLLHAFSSLTSSGCLSEVTCFHPFGPQKIPWKHASMPTACRHYF